MARASDSFVVALVLLVSLGSLAEARSKYPPGPPYRTCPDTLTLYSVQQPDTMLAPCHPAYQDSVWGVRGVITAFDAKPSTFGFYMQDNLGGPQPWTGILVFTGATNYNAPVPGTPTGGNLTLGDSVAVYGSTTEFSGESEIEGPDVILSTNDIIIRKISGGNPLPAAMTGTTAMFNRLAALSASTSEPWEGCLVRVDGPLRVARTTGLGANLFLAVAPSQVGDSILVDGNALTTFGAPAVGTDIGFVRGILNQRIVLGVDSYKIQLRDASDIAIVVPPSLVDAYPLEDHRLRLVFDQALTLVDAEEESNFSLARGGIVNNATLVGGAGTMVDLDISTPLSDGDLDTVTATHQSTPACPTCFSSPQTRPFVNGVLTVAVIQAPDPAALAGPCEDRSRFAGPGSLMGPRLTLRAVAVQSYGSLYFVADFVPDDAGGARNGVAVFAPISPLDTGRRYRISGAVQEFQGVTEVVGVVAITDEGPAAVLAPAIETIAALRDTTCDADQGATTGEDFEGGVVRVEQVRIVQDNGSTADLAPGGSFRVVPIPPTPDDTLLVVNPNGRYTFDPDTGRVLDVAGILHFTGGFRILPRSDADLSYVDGIEPDHAGNLGSVSVTLSGHGFEPGTSVRATRSGQPDIAATQVTASADTRSLTAVFDLAGAALGGWVVVVTKPDLSVSTVPDTFVIQGEASQQLRVDVIGPSFLRPQRRKAFDIVIQNQGTSDALSVPLWIDGIPSSATVEADFPVTAPPDAGGEPDWDQAPLAFPGPNGQYLVMVIPRVAPGSTVRRIFLTVPNTVTSFTLSASLAPTWEDIAPFRSCLVGAGATQAPACVGTELTAINAYLAATPGIEALNGIGLWARVGFRCEGAATVPLALAYAQQALGVLQPPPPPAPPGCEDVRTPLWQDRREAQVVTSVDPNDKLGVRGFGTGGAIGADQNLSYSIRFENLETATAPAQQVVVTDLLDGSTLDLGTVSLDRITFGDVHIDPPPGLTAYSTRVDLRPGRDVLVDVGASLDRATGMLTWFFGSVDPATGQPPEDPFAGFLPPNQQPPEGEGSVLFTIRPRPGLSQGAVIRNRATISFDGVPLVTPDWSNTVDTTPPESEVSPLPPNQTTVTFSVQWQANGSPSDLRDFSVYVSENGGDFRPWRVFTTATTDTFSGRGGNSYSFYSLARDSSGNIQSVPSEPQAQTYSTADVPGEERFVLSLEGARPNPTTRAARVWFTLPNRDRAVLEAVDVAGRRVFRREVGSLGAGRHSVDVVPSVRGAGLYFLRLAQGGRTLRARVVVIR